MDETPKPEEKKDEKLEFLKREEVRTMAKDISHLREAEAQKEREKIAAISPPAKPVPPVRRKVPEFKEEVPLEKRPFGTIIPRPPKRPASSRKILVRSLILVVIILIIGVSVWFLFFQKEQPSEIVIPPEEEMEEEAEEEVEEPITEEEEIIIPPALILVNSTSTLEIAFLEEFKIALPQLLSNIFEPDSFTRVLIENKKENKVLGLKEFFEVFGIETPEGLLDKFGDDFTLFIYSSQDTNRLGFVTEVLDKEGLADLLVSWENTMESDTENLFTVLGKEGLASISYFRTASYQGRVFRYISFPPDNFGICWAIIDDYFLFTSSGESMIKLMNLLTEGE